MKRLLALALLLPLAAPGASTNRLDLAFEKARLADVAEHLGRSTPLKLIVPPRYGDLELSMNLKQAALEDVLALLNLQFACERADYKWRETKLTEERTAYVLDEGPAAIATRPPAEGVKGLKALPRVSLELKDASLREVAQHLEKLTDGGMVLLYGAHAAEYAVDLKLQDVTPVDALLALNELLRASGEGEEWLTVTLPSGRTVFALLEIPEASPEGPEPGPGGPQTPRVYFIGDLGPELRGTAAAIRELVVLNAPSVRVDLHEGTRMLVVRASEEDHAFVKNVVEEMRRGQSAKPPAPETKP